MFFIQILIPEEGAVKLLSPFPNQTPSTFTFRAPYLRTHRIGSRSNKVYGLIHTMELRVNGKARNEMLADYFLF